MKGIILAGGHGTRLSPSTLAISKQLIPIYDKPMIYYPLSVLMLAGIQEILIISDSQSLLLYKNLFINSKERLGIDLHYAVQENPNGLAEAFIIGEDFIGYNSVCLVLGDNILYGHTLTKKLESCAKLESGGLVFGYYVDHPEEYGVLDIGENYDAIGVEEKPKNPKSNYAIPGIYFFDHQCVEYARQAKPSHRGEIEITSVIQQYINYKNLKVEILGRGFSWLDTGTHENLIEASIFVNVIEKRQGLKIACLEEIAYHKEFINFQQLKESCKWTEKSQYGEYLQKVINTIQYKQIIR